MPNKNNFLLGDVLSLNLNAEIFPGEYANWMSKGDGHQNDDDGDNNKTRSFYPAGGDKCFQISVTVFKRVKTCFCVIIFATNISKSRSAVSRMENIADRDWIMGVEKMETRKEMLMYYEIDDSRIMPILTAQKWVVAAYHWWSDKIW